MSTSKLNLILLECFDDIFSEYKEDRKTLYSFLFVNRFWCKSIIPLLWKNPFSITSKGKEIKTLSSLLNEEEKSIIIKQGINLSSDLALFNYALYIEEYNTNKLYQSIKSWYILNLYDDIYYRISYTDDVKIQLQNIFEVFTKLIMRNSRNIKGFSLYSIFNSIDDIPYVDIYINSQVGFKNIQNFEINFSFSTPNTTSLLKSLKNISHNIQDLRIKGRMDEEIIDSIVPLIKAQHKISFVSLNIISPKFTPILEALSTHSNSLTTLRLIEVSNGNISLAPIRQLKNLQNLVLSNCNFDENMFNGFSNTDFNLKSLYIADMKKKVIISLLKLTNENLEEFYCPLNLPDEVIKDLFIRSPKIYYIKVLNSSIEKKVNFKLLLMLEDSLTHLIIPSLYVDNLNEISLRKLKFLSIRLPYLVNILKNYLKTTCSPLQTIFFSSSSSSMFNKKYMEVLLEFSKEKKTLKTVGISLSTNDPYFKELVKMADGYFQIVNIWNMNL